MEIKVGLKSCIFSNCRSKKFVENNRGRRGKASFSEFIFARPSEFYGFPISFPSLNIRDSSCHTFFLQKKQKKLLSLSLQKRKKKERNVFPLGSKLEIKRRSSIDPKRYN
jgi:hypothetical protein